MSKYILHYQGNYKSWKKPFPIKPEIPNAIMENWKRSWDISIYSCAIIPFSKYLYKFNTKIYGYNHSRSKQSGRGRIIVEIFKFSFLIIKAGIIQR